MFRRLYFDYIVLPRLVAAAKRFLLKELTLALIERDQKGGFNESEKIGKTEYRDRETGEIIH